MLLQLPSTKLITCPLPVTKEMHNSKKKGLNARCLYCICCFRPCRGNAVYVMNLQQISSFTGYVTCTASNLQCMLLTWKDRLTHEHTFCALNRRFLLVAVCYSGITVCCLCTVMSTCKQVDLLSSVQSICLSLCTVGDSVLDPCHCDLTSDLLVNTVNCCFTVVPSEKSQ